MEGYYDQIMTYLLDQVGYSKKTQNHLVSVMSKILKCKEATVYNKIIGRSRFTVEELFLIARELNVSLDNIIYKDAPDRNSFLFSADGLRFRPRLYKDYIDNIILHFGMLKAFDSPRGIFLANEVPLFHFLRFPNLFYLKLYIWNITNWKIPNLSEYYAPESITNDPEIQHSARILYSLFNSFHSTEIWNPSMLETTIAQIRYLIQSNRITNPKHISDLIANLHALTNYLEQIANLGYKVNHQNENKSTIEIYINELLTNAEIILIEAEGKSILYNQFDLPNYIKSSEPLVCDYAKGWLNNIISKSTSITKTGDRDKKLLFRKLNKSIEQLSSEVGNK